MVTGFLIAIIPCGIVAGYRRVLGWMFWPAFVISLGVALLLYGLGI